MANQIIEVKDASFSEEVLAAGVPVLADFWATWCGPCRMQAPVLEELAAAYAGKLKVVKVNVDENRESPGKFGIMSIPTLILFKAGKDVLTLIGYQNLKELEAKIKPYL